MFGRYDIYCTPNNIGKQKDWNVHHLEAFSSGGSNLKYWLTYKVLGNWQGRKKRHVLSPTTCKRPGNLLFSFWILTRFIWLIKSYNMPLCHWRKTNLSMIYPLKLVSCWFLEFNFPVTYFFLECRKYFVQNYIEQIKNPMTFLRTVKCIIHGTFQKVDSQGIFYSPSFLISILVFLKNYCTNLMHRKCHYEDFALNMLAKFSTKFIFKTLQLTRS